MNDEPYTASARIYDLLYAAIGKDYEKESADIHDLIQRSRPGAATLLDVACGTGEHLVHLRQWYEVAGVDAAPEMIEQAKAKIPTAAFAVADMRAVELGRTFDAVTCLFSAIGYMPSTVDLDVAVATMARHLRPGGVLIVDGWVRREAWSEAGSLDVQSTRTNELGIARVGRSWREGDRTTIEMHHLIGSLDRVDYFIERHEMTLFSDADYRRAYSRAGLDVDVAAGPHPDRDRYVGVRPH
jgi:SAM-dependent methyltransferase